MVGGWLGGGSQGMGKRSTWRYSEYYGTNQNEIQKTKPFTIASQKP
jgi:hypothetical protein